MDRELEALTAQPNVRFVQADLANPNGFDKVGKGFDVTYHLAAVNGTRHFYEKPHTVLRTNLLSVIWALDWAVADGTRQLVWTSSCEVYAGNWDLGTLPLPTPEAVPMVISDVFNPRFSYAASKIAGELLCIHYARVYGLPVLVVRPHNVYGPRMGSDHVVPAFVQRALRRDDPFHIYGGDQTRTFCYVDDFTESLVRAAVAYRTRTELINLGSNREEILIRNLAQKICAQVGYQPRFEEHPAPEGSVPRRLPDMRKVQGDVGFEPRTSLEEGLSRTLAWYLREHEEGRLVETH
jgi:UDP-glucose 4-epimerase/UDP-glucuronate decarboxylase